VPPRPDGARNRGLEVVHVDPDDPAEQPTIEFEAVA
jgi:hypothetical protein